MKRLMAAALATVLVAGAFAQGTFTIRRPADGSKVREVVNVRIPKNSIPEGGYLGILVNGKFLEAVVPDVEGDDYVYKLDTKKRRLADGPLTIEAVLYLYREGAPMVLNRSSVNVTLDNSTSINASRPDGFKLRYKFTPGREYIYNRKDKSTIALISQAQAQLGSRAAEIELDEENVRYLIAHENVYKTANGTEGLIRMQALPDKGKDSAMLIVSGETTAKKYMDFEMHPIFMRVTDTGREVFTSLPIYFPMEGTSGEGARFDLFALFPIAVMPAKNVEVGDKWQAAIPQPDLDLDNRNTKDKFVENLPGSAILEGVEWEQGVPCAKIRSELALGARDLKNFGNFNGIEGEAQNIKFESVQWFAIDRGIMIKEEGRFTVEVLVEVAPQAAGGGGGPASSGASGGGGRTGGGRGPATGQPGGDEGGRINFPGGVAPFQFVTNSIGSLINQRNSLRLMQDSFGGGPGGPTNTGGSGFNNGDGRGNSSTGSVPVKMILRQSSVYTVTLEK
ncbi:MAG: hypothetical protein KF824_08520 [Fimbriimonadaceae bacterium]|nr:MAG: hypothetical protein KF824_08520 [Fimbriimonadaceae bacterium]